MEKIVKGKVKKTVRVKKESSCCRDNPLVDVVNYLAEHGKEHLARRIVQSILR